MKKNNYGFSFIEILIVCLLLSIVIIGSFYVFHTGFALMEQLRGSVIALSDAESIIENMRNIDSISAANLTAAYPNGAIVSGFNNLANETVKVEYADLSTDPIKVYVIVKWEGQGGRLFTEQLVTLLTKR
ncbi:MAG: prepilin-type N-terminal cleavage/methylation domain-containing protein [Candidatus Omnitrophica bacterium]|nr:prepilin-type N-terminal cleavage/methylation domain-containing protein [Candidatus Omnitrophota bacterium]